MKLLSTLTEDMKNAMLGKKKYKDDAEKVSRSNIILAEISILKSKLILAEKDNKKDNKKDLDIKQEYKIVKKEKEETEKASLEFAKGKREDLVEESDVKLVLLNRYMIILEVYMPKQLSEEEIGEEIKKLMQDLLLSHDNLPFTKRDMGMFMKELKIRFKGNADMRIVSSMLSEILH